MWAGWPAVRWDNLPPPCVPRDPPHRPGPHHCQLPGCLPWTQLAAAPCCHEARYLYRHSMVIHSVCTGAMHKATKLKKRIKKFPKCKLPAFKSRTEKRNSIYIFTMFTWTVVNCAGVRSHCWATHQVRRLWPFQGKAVWAWVELRASVLLWGTETGRSLLSAHPHLGPQSLQGQSPKARKTCTTEVYRVYVGINSRVQFSFYATSCNSYDRKTTLFMCKLKVLLW